MVPGIPLSVIEPLVLRRGAPNRTPATIRLARNYGVTRVVSANDEKSPTFIGGAESNNREQTQHASEPRGTPVRWSNTPRKWPRKDIRLGIHGPVTVHGRRVANASEGRGFCLRLSIAVLQLPKEMHIKDEPLKIREVRHVIVGAIKADDKAIEHDEIPAIEDKSDRDPD
jgi:hypothetical protein